MPYFSIFFRKMAGAEVRDLNQHDKEPVNW